ncbi:hypothetical protein KC343_g8640 [Hortaea werneckii]|uniref:IQ calmodulin-binding motif protein n=1 Tax=Hortaea werneckii TaxID=91943 RepID=A0A3M7GA63_HORWE|nr:hypothetical protein KC352_g12711 [Hortaea werneckii]KAI7565869.1 hypothetical protein KC317_g6064 [Hortaea werneckii]KAI7617054.1 hypothetical protein KC346_g5680 [Hortaea werneckii]KAI7619659.1 hypothetical protein KC343_g8640 [Hortaea werneckii]KAI7656129.1 hypothetical protein KC319_g9802 [Hortaea werneckii]
MLTGEALPTKSPAEGRGKMSRQEYLATLRRPSTLEVARITARQIQKEREVHGKHHRHTAEEDGAATKIQKAYRGHRERRQLEGLTLDPSSRWTETLKELRHRCTTASQWQTSEPVADGRALSPSDRARHNWRRVAWVAENASAGESGSPEANDSMLMDLRYFLEMTDTQHRYGANLQVYHADWKRSQTKQNFFTWLDHGEGSDLDLAGCSREKLERERIRYLSREERRDYLVHVDTEGRLRWQKNGDLVTTSGELYRDSIQGIVAKDSSIPAWAYEQDDAFDRIIASPFDDDETRTRTITITTTATATSNSSNNNDNNTLHNRQEKSEKKRTSLRVSPATILNRLLRATIRPGTWIYVVDTLGRLYVGIKTSGTFQHASFLSGARILSAGSIGVEAGQLTYLAPLSGHYTPTTRSFRRFVERVGDQGADLSQLRVSRAYEVLVGMECYGKAREGLEYFGRFPHRDRPDGRQHQQQEAEEEEEGEGPEDGSKWYGRRRKGTLPAARVHAVNASAADFVEQRWDSKHEQKAGLRRLLGDLHLKGRRQSGD